MTHADGSASTLLLCSPTDRLSGRGPASGCRPTWRCGAAVSARSWRLDLQHVPGLVAVGQASKVRRASGSASSAAAKSAGTLTSRGAVSRSMSRSTSSPPATPAAARCSALRLIMEAPPMTATVLR